MTLSFQCEYLWFFHRHGICWWYDEGNWVRSNLLRARTPCSMRYEKQERRKARTLSSSRFSRLVAIRYRFGTKSKYIEHRWSVSNWRTETRDRDDRVGLLITADGVIVTGAIDGTVCFYSIDSLTKVMQISRHLSEWEWHSFSSVNIGFRKPSNAWCSFKAKRFSSNLRMIYDCSRTHWFVEEHSSSIVWYRVSCSSRYVRSQLPCKRSNKPLSPFLSAVFHRV